MKYLTFVPADSQDGGDLISRQTHKVEPKTRAVVGTFIETPTALTGGEGYPATALRRSAAKVERQGRAPWGAATLRRTIKGGRHGR